MVLDLSLWHKDSLVVACRFTCSIACRDLSSLMRDGTHVSCTARQILNHRVTSEVPLKFRFCPHPVTYGILVP